MTNTAGLKQESQAREDDALVQWVHRLNAELARAKAQIAENNGLMSFEVLMEGDRRVDAKLIPTKYGVAWLLSGSEKARFSRKFVPFSGIGRSRIQRQLGLRESWEKAPAVARITGNVEKGQAWVIVSRTDGK